MFRSLIVFAALIGIAAPAQAEPEPLDVAPDEDWVHEASGLKFPTQIGGFVRDRIVSYRDGESDIGSSYFSDDGSEILSIYVYRSGSYDVSMMADASIAVISTNTRLGTVDQGNAMFSTFGDAALGANSGVRATLPVDGTFRSTGLALFRSGNWLIKMRFSSKQVDAQSLDQRLALLASGLSLRSPAQPAPAAYRIESCGDVPERPKAVSRTLEMTDWLVATTPVSLSYDESVTSVVKRDDDDGSASRLCRDSRSEPGQMFYREEETGDPLAIVFGDSGAVASVKSTGISLNEGVLPPIVLSASDGVKTEFFQGYESTPGFDQMLETLQNGRVMASVERSGEGSKITLPSSE